MPGLDKAIRRERKREKERRMVVSGRGLITDRPNEDRRKKKADRDKKRKIL